MVATDNTPGINPLLYDLIIEDLDTLLIGEKGVLYFYWGREHIYFPEIEQIKIAKLRLEDDRVLSIIGMHCHRMQGVLEYNNKKAYFSQGNFLFPDFYIRPTTKIYYPESPLMTVVKTYLYHDVYIMTYKLWKWINRVSIILVMDTETLEIKHEFAKQLNKSPKVESIEGVELYLVKFLFDILSKSFYLPNVVCRLIQSMNVILLSATWRLGVLFFKLKQLGFVSFLKKATERFDYDKK